MEAFMKYSIRAPIAKKMLDVFGILAAVLFLIFFLTSCCSNNKPPENSFEKVKRSMKVVKTVYERIFPIVMSTTPPGRLGQLCTINDKATQVSGICIQLLQVYCENGGNEPLDANELIINARSLKECIQQIEALANADNTVKIFTAAAFGAIEIILPLVSNITIIEGPDAVCDLAYLKISSICLPTRLHLAPTREVRSATISKEDLQNLAKVLDDLKSVAPKEFDQKLSSVRAKLD
jgi:hypothetical protein